MTATNKCYNFVGFRCSPPEEWAFKRDGLEGWAFKRNGLLRGMGF